MSLSSSSLSSLSSLNILLNDAVQGCSKPFAVRIIHQAVGQFDDTLQNAFHSELGDHYYIQRRNEYNALYGRNTETVVKTTGIDALKALRNLLSQYNATGIKCDYCDHQLTVLAEYSVFGK